MGAVIAGVVLSLLIIFAICHWSLRGAKRVILKHVARDGHYAVKVAYTAEIWNPGPRLSLGTLSAPTTRT